VLECGECPFPPSAPPLKLVQACSPVELRPAAQARNLKTAFRGRSQRLIARGFGSADALVVFASPRQPPPTAGWSSASRQPNREPLRPHRGMSCVPRGPAAHACASDIRLLTLAQSLATTLARPGMTRRPPPPPHPPNALALPAFLPPPRGDRPSAPRQAYAERPRWMWRSTHTQARRRAPSPTSTSPDPTITPGSGQDSRRCLLAARWRRPTPRRASLMGAQWAGSGDDGRKALVDTQRAARAPPLPRAGRPPPSPANRPHLRLTLRRSLRPSPPIVPALSPPFERRPPRRGW